MGKFFRTAKLGSAWVYQGLVAFLITLVLMPQLGLVLDRRFELAIAPSLDILVVLSVIPLLVFTHEKWLHFLKSPFFFWFTFTAILFAFGLFRVYYGNDQLTYEDVQNETNAAQKLLIFGACAYCVYSINIRYFQIGLSIALLLIPLLIILDFFAPETFTTIYENYNARASGTFANPNQAAEAVILIGLLNLTRLKGTLALVLSLILCLAVVLTFSRAGIAACLIFSCYMIWRNKLTPFFLIVPVLFSVFLGSIVLVAEDTLDSLGYGANIKSVVYRLQFFNNIEEDNIIGDDHSAEARTEIVSIALQESTQKPLVGYGFGSYVQEGISPHNLLVHLLYKFGMLGLIAWFALAYIIYKQGMVRKLGIFNPALLIFIWFSFFTHNILDDRSWIVFLSFVLLKDPLDWHGVTGSENYTKKGVNRLTKSIANNTSNSNRRKSRRKIRF